MNSLLPSHARGLGDAEELDAVAEFPGHLEVEGYQPLDPLGGDGLEGPARAKGHAGEQGQLVGGVDALDVEGRVRLGVAQLLGLLQDDLELLAGPLHLGQHEVGGPVQDAVDALDAIGREALAQRAQDRNPAADRGLEGDADALLRSRLEDLRPCTASSALLAVTTCLPPEMASRVSLRAKS